jgi:hypothetical protein
MRSIVQTTFKTRCLQLDVKLVIFVAIDRNNALSSETIFLGKSNVNEERNFTGKLSFLWDQKFLTEAAHLYVEASESV